MPRKKKSQQERIDEALEAATAAGEQYAKEQLDSDYFQDWLREQVAEAAKMERDRPGSTIDDPRRIARNMLQQLRWDIHQNMDNHTLRSLLDKIDTGDPESVSADELSKAFYDGLDEALESESARDWLADEVRHVSGEMAAQQGLSGVNEADWLEYNTRLAKLMQRLKRDAAAASIAQNYRGTGSQAARRQLWIRFNSGATIDVWLEDGYAKLGGVVNNRPPGGETLTTRRVQYGETPEQTYEAVLATLKPWANPGVDETAREEAYGRGRYGVEMKRPVVHVTIRTEHGDVLHSETKSAFNSGIRASEDAVREIARSERTTYEGDRPTRAGDVYTRRWVGRNGRAVIATIEKQSGGHTVRSRPMPGGEQPAPPWAARVVITSGTDGRVWSAKVYDKAGHLRTGANNYDREYVEAWAAMYFPGVPIEYEKQPPPAPVRRRRTRR